MLSDAQFEAIWGTRQAEIECDLVGIWMLRGAVRDALPGLSDEEVREAVLDVIERAVRDGEAEAASYDRGVEDDVAWTEIREETRARVEREWIALGHDPDPGEILWLREVGTPPRTPPQKQRDREFRDRIRARFHARTAWQAWWSTSGRAGLSELLWERGIRSAPGSLLTSRRGTSTTGTSARSGGCSTTGRPPRTSRRSLRDAMGNREHLEPEGGTDAVAEEIVAWLEHAAAEFGDR